VFIRCKAREKKAEVHTDTNWQMHIQTSYGLFKSYFVVKQQMDIGKRNVMRAKCTLVATGSSDDEKCDQI
jgi:hypothetical protein